MALTLKAVTSCIGYQQITSLSAAAGLTVPAVDKSGNKQQPTFALIVAEGKDVRWRYARNRRKPQDRDGTK